MFTLRRRVEGDKFGGYEYVDLGLPSGLLWAKCNVGATKETLCGNYYKYGAGATAGATDTSYYTGTETQLSTSKDTARLVMGSGWRTPTKAQYLELMNNTIVSDGHSELGVPGIICRSKSKPKEYVFFQYRVI